MKAAWFEHVSKTRKKLTRQRKEPVSHREAMSEASKSWPKEKIKAAKRIARRRKKESKETQQPAQKKVSQ